MRKGRSFEPRDVLGRRLKPGDMVRVVGAPDLRGMSPADLRQARTAFRHVLGTYRRIDGFDRPGLAEISFRVPSRSGRRRPDNGIPLAIVMLC